MVCYGGSADFTNVSLEGNAASETGGGFMYDSSGLWFPSAGPKDLSHGHVERDQHLELMLRNVTIVGNKVLRGEGGGGTSVDGCVRVIGGVISGNSASTGGGLSIRGQGCRSAVAWEFVDVAVQDNAALSGGGMLVTGDVADLSSEPLYQSTGIPFWLDNNPMFVSARTSGNSVTVCNIVTGICPVFSMSLAGQSQEKHPHPLSFSQGKRYLISGNPNDKKYMVWDLIHLETAGRMDFVDEIEAETIQYQINEVPGVASANVLTDFHPGWGACGASSTNWLAASLFKSVVLFNISTLKLETIGCLTDVNALAEDPSGEILFAAVWDSTWGVAHIVGYDVTVKQCTEIGSEWGVDGSGNLLSEFNVIRGLAVSSNRQFLYVVEQLAPVETLFEEVQLVVISIESGLRRHIAANSRIFSVAYLRVLPLAEGGEKLRIVIQKKDESCTLGPCNPVP